MTAEKLSTGQMSTGQMGTGQMSTGQMSTGPLPTDMPQPEATSGDRGADWRARVRDLGPLFADRAAALDDLGAFVAENYADLKRHGFFAAGVPTEFGGAGLTHAELCGVVRELAHFCGSTALALSMHQHLVAAAVWRHGHGQPGEALLRRVAAENLVLVSTGGRDWLASSGEMVRAEGGYRVTARKAFSSGCLAGDLLISSARYDDPQEGPRVLHFALPLGAPGVRIEQDWHTLGMRGSGSHTVLLEDVFVPDAAVSLSRPRGAWHPVWSVVLGVAMPLIMAAYVGVAEAAAAQATGRARRAGAEPPLPYLLGELQNDLTAAQLALEDMTALSANYAFEPTVEHADRVLVRKTLCSRAVLAAVEKSLEVMGGAGFYRAAGLERSLRDIHGAQFHPLPEKPQQYFTGRLMLGLDPVPSPS